MSNWEWGTGKWFLGRVMSNEIVLVIPLRFT